LWYLPLLMMGFVLHNRNWQEQTNTAEALAVAPAALAGSKDQSSTDEILITAAAASAAEDQSAKEEVQKEDVVSGAVRGAKETLRGLCVHEAIVSGGNAQPHLCAKVGLDEAVEQGRSAAGEVVAAAVAVAAVEAETKT